MRLLISPNVLEMLFSVAVFIIPFCVSGLLLFIFSILFLHQGDCSQITLSNSFPLFGLKN